MDRLVDDSADSNEQLLLTTRKFGDKMKADFFKITLKLSVHQKEKKSSETSKGSVTLEALTSSMPTMSTAVPKMPDTLVSKPKLICLQRLPVSKWDGRRRSYAARKEEFNHWIMKCDQDKDEQLQMFSKCDATRIVVTGGDNSNKRCFGTKPKLLPESGDFSGNRDTWKFFRETRDNSGTLQKKIGTSKGFLFHIFI